MLRDGVLVDIFDFADKSDSLGTGSKSHLTGNSKIRRLIRQ